MVPEIRYPSREGDEKATTYNQGQSSWKQTLNIIWRTTTLESKPILAVAQSFWCHCVQYRTGGIHSEQWIYARRKVFYISQRRVGPISGWRHVILYRTDTQITTFTHSVLRNSLFFLRAVLIDITIHDSCAHSILEYRFSSKKPDTSRRMIYDYPPQATLFLYHKKEMSACLSRSCAATSR